MVIDLGAIDWVNAPGLRALEEAQERFAKRGAHVFLARASKRIHNLFIIATLSLFFDTFEKVGDAILAGSREVSTPA